MKGIENFEGDGYFEGQLLIATPMLVGSCFAKSVVYLCSHNAEGAMGVIINQRIANIDCNEIYTQLGIELDQDIQDIPVHFGGPVDTSRGFVLHTSDYAGTETVVMEENISLTANIDVLKDIALGKGPTQCILALGYAGWSPSQLEKEIEQNSWISVPATEELVFGTSNDSKWIVAAQSLGIDMAKFSSMTGHA